MRKGSSAKIGWNEGKENEAKKRTPTTKGVSRYEASSMNLFQKKLQVSVILCFCTFQKRQPASNFNIWLLVSLLPWQESDTHSSSSCSNSLRTTVLESKERDCQVSNVQNLQQRRRWGVQRKSILEQYFAKIWLKTQKNIREKRLTTKSSWLKLRD